MKTRLQKWGNSLAVRIPKSFAKSLGFVGDSPVEMSLEDGTIIIKPDRERTWNLDSLLSKITNENIHPEWERGPLADGIGGKAAEEEGE